MKTSLLAASLVSLALSAGALPARAADLDYGPIPSERFSAYDDPRYRDLYGPTPRHEAPFYRAVPPGPVPPGTIYGPPDTYGPAPRRYSYEREDWRERQGCVPRGEVRRRLVDDGWRDFQDLDIRGPHALVRARRPNGDVFDLRVDRCTGEVVNAELLRRGAYGPYAEDHGRRYVPPRPYY